MNTSLNTSLGRLEGETAADRAMRDGLAALIEKERRLAELQLLKTIALSGGGGALSGGAGGAPRAGAHLGASDDDAAGGGGEPGADGPLPFDAADAQRVSPADVAPRSGAPGGPLRPRARRPELSASELALLKLAPERAGLNLSRLGLSDDALGELTAVFQALTGEGVSLRVLDVRRNALGKGGAAALCDALQRFDRLEALCAEDNELGGRAGVGALVELLARAAAVGHVGLTLNDAPPLPFSTEIVVTPPGVEVPKPPRAAPPKKGAAAGAARAASPAKRAPGAAAAAGKAKGKAGAAAGAGGEPGTAGHLAAALRAHSAVASVSLAGSALPRDALIKFLSAWAPPPPRDPPAPVSVTAGGKGAGAAAGAGAGAKKGGARAATPAKAAPAKAAPAEAPAAAGAKAGAAGAKAPAAKYTPLLALSLARTGLGALGALDVSLALAPVPGPGDPAGQLGRLSTAVPAVPAAAAAAPAAAAPAAAAPAAAAGGKGKGKGDAAARGRGRASAGGAEAPPPAAAPPPPPPPARPTLHGSLLFLRALDLSACGLTSHGLLPVADAVARHALCLSFLGLADNFLDDDAAGALATALRMNHARLGAYAADAAALAAAADPLAALRGAAAPPPPPERAAAARATTAWLFGAGLAPCHAAPLRVLDVRNNPLALSADPAEHPGCAALVRALAELPAALSLTGPPPGVGGVLHARREALLGRPDPAAGGAGLGDAALLGVGGAWFFDAAALAGAARDALGGVPSGDTRALLAMPARFAHAAGATALAKVAAALAAAEAARAARGAGADGGGGGGGGEAGGQPGPRAAPAPPPASGPPSSSTTLLWRLHAPAAAALVHRGVVSSPLTSAHSGALALAALPSGGAPHDVGAAAPPDALGALVLAAPLRGGLSGSAADAPAVVAGAPTWRLAAPRVLLEWRATYAAPAAVAPLAPALSLVWHVTIGPPPGAAGGPATHVYTARFADGSRDRAHARVRAAERVAALAAAPGAPGAAAAALAAAAAAQGAAALVGGAGAGAGAGAHGGAFDWADAAGLDTPAALGAHNDVNIALALPPGAAAHAVAASGATVVAWPVAWHCAELPPGALLSLPGAVVSVRAEVLQTAARGGGPGVTAAAALAAAALTPYAVVVLEAEVVALGGGGGGGGGEGGGGGGEEARAARALADEWAATADGGAAGGFHFL